jgi:hypothetical protein
VGGGIAGGERARSAYVFSPERSGALRLAFHLLAADVRVSVATLGAEAGGRQWPRGTFVVRVARNDSSVHATVDRLARESGVDVVAVNSAFTERDQFGIGGDEIVPLERPRIAIVGDEGIAQTSFGDLWWGLERRYGLDFAHLGWAAIGRDLSRYNVIVIPSGSPTQIGARLGKDGVDRLKAWVRGGGTLVTMGAASTWAAREDVGLTSARAVGAGDDAKGDAKGDAKPAPARRDSAAARRAAPAREDLLAATSPGADSVAPVELPGSNFDVVLDRTHWLTFGYERPRLTALVEGGTFLKLSREGSNVAVFPTTGPLVRGGFTWPENTERTLRGSAMLIEEPLGSGHVILFTNEPMFRGWWRALDKLALNAMVLAPAF